MLSVHLAVWFYSKCKVTKHFGHWRLVLFGIVQSPPGFSSTASLVFAIKEKHSSGRHHLPQWLRQRWILTMIHSYFFNLNKQVSWRWAWERWTWNEKFHSQHWSTRAPQEDAHSGCLGGGLRRQVTLGLSASHVTTSSNPKGGNTVIPKANWLDWKSSWLHIVPSASKVKAVSETFLHNKMIQEYANFSLKTNYSSWEFVLYVTTFKMTSKKIITGI